ncbi:hypothetical protein BD777DRAFT_125365 [Yarrowia lipolytica]|nr:hypothetical protein BD777DRAFT_125365 [Yarrowia lipolytica]
MGTILWVPRRKPPTRKSALPGVATGTRSRVPTTWTSTARFSPSGPMSSSRITFNDVKVATCR